MFRLTKLIKLFDVNKVKRLIKGYYDKSTKTDAYKEGYLVLYFYKLFRLTLIVFVGSFFAGSLWWLLVTEGNFKEDERTGHTFEKWFKFDEMLIED